MTALEELLARHEKEGGLSDEFTPLEKAVLYWYLQEGDDSEAKEAAAELVVLYA